MSLFGNIVKFVASPITAPMKAIASAVGEIPIIGTPLKAVVNLGCAPTNLVESIASGERLDHAVIDNIKSQVKDIKTVAPYAKMVVSLVPGVGTAVSAAISAGAALAEGQSITDALIEGVKGAIPGGAIAQSAFNVASGVVSGKSIKDIGISALPISDGQRKALTTVVSLTSDLANGRSIKDITINALPIDEDQKKTLNVAATFATDIVSGQNVIKSIIANAQSQLPNDINTAINIGTAMAFGQNMQRNAGIPVGSPLTGITVNGQPAQADVQILFASANAGADSAIAGQRMQSDYAAYMLSKAAQGAAAQDAAISGSKMQADYAAYMRAKPSEITKIYGMKIAKANPILNAGFNLLTGTKVTDENNLHGYCSAIGMMSYRSTPADIEKFLSTIPLIEQTGFNIGCAAIIGLPKIKITGDNLADFGTVVATGLNNATIVEKISAVNVVGVNPVVANSIITVSSMNQIGWFHRLLIKLHIVSN